MTTSPTPTDAMVEAMRTALRQNAQHRLLNQLLTDCDLRDIFTAALQHQEPGGMCRRCAGNGEVVTDWDRYLHPSPDDQGDAAVVECPDCDGTGKVATPPEPSALDRAVECLEDLLFEDSDKSEKDRIITRLKARQLVEAIRGNGGGTEEKVVTDSCGCVFCDLNVPKANLKGIAYHEERDGNLIRCEAPDDKR